MGKESPGPPPLQIDTDAIVERLSERRVVPDRSTRPQHAVVTLADVHRHPDDHHRSVLVVAGGRSKAWGAENDRFGHRNVDRLDGLPRLGDRG